MKPNEQARNSDEIQDAYRHLPTQPQNSLIQQQQQHLQLNNQQYDNPVVSERIDSLIYGYLRRNGHNQAADALEQESPFLRSSISRFGAVNRAVVMVNDRLHDHTLEDVISLFHRDGRFGVSQSMIDFGEELRKLTNRYHSIVTNPGAIGSNSLHQQLYGKPAHSRHRQPRQYTARPAPQAIAQMKLQQLNQVAEERYRQEQKQVEKCDFIPAPHASSSAPQLLSLTLKGEHQQEIPIHFQEQQVDAREICDYEEGAPRSRRKVTQPQNLNSRVENALVPLVDLINDRPLDEMMDIDFTTGFNLEGIRPEFIRALDYGPEDDMMHQDAQQDDHHFNEVFGDILENENQNIDGSSLKVQEEVVVETEEGLIEVEDGDFNGDRVIVYPDAPEPLISPLPKDMGFRKQQTNTALREQYCSLKEDLKNCYVIPKKHRDVPPASNSKVEDKERKFKKTDGRPTRHSLSPQRNRTSDDSRRYREREKERDRDRESDRESTSSNSSRVIGPDKRDRDEKGRKQKEKEIRKLTEVVEKEKDHSSKEREREKLKQGYYHSRTGMSEQSSDSINKSKSSSSASTSKQFEAQNVYSASSSNAVKRKGSSIDIDNQFRKDFKIPKRPPSLSVTKSESRTSHGYNPSTVQPASSSKSEKSGMRKSPTEELSHGDERADATHFINPIGHLARLSSILLNCDKTYGQFQAGLQRKDNKQRQSTSTQSPSSSSSAKLETPPLYSNISSQVTVNTNPKGLSFAPRKGPKLIKPKTPSSSELDSDEERAKRSSSSDESDTSSENSRCRSPEQKKERHEAIDKSKTDKLMDKIHGSI